MTAGRRSLVGPTLVSLAFALFVGPGPIGLLGPWLITHWEIEDPLLGVTACRWLGVVLLALGLPCLGSRSCGSCASGGGRSCR